MAYGIKRRILGLILLVVVIVIGSYLMGFRIGERPSDSYVASDFIFEYYNGSIRGRVDGLAKFQRLESLMAEETFLSAVGEGTITRDGIAGNGFLEEIDTNQVMLSSIFDGEKEKKFRYQTNTRLKIDEDTIHTVRFNGEVTVEEKDGSWVVTGFYPDFDNIQVMTTYGRSYLRLADRTGSPVQEVKVSVEGLDRTFHIKEDESVIQLQMPSNKEQVFSVEVLLDGGDSIINQFVGDFSDGKNVDIVVQLSEKNQLEMVPASLVKGIAKELGDMDVIPDKKLVEYKVSRLLGGGSVLELEVRDSDDGDSIIRVLADHSLRYATIKQFELDDLEEYYRIDEFNTLSGEVRTHSIFKEKGKYILQRDDGLATEISGASYRELVELLN